MEAIYTRPLGLGWCGDENVPCTCTHVRCYAIGLKTYCSQSIHVESHDSRRFHSGFEEVAALTSENKNSLLRRWSYGAENQWPYKGVTGVKYITPISGVENPTYNC